jgi:pyruvate formate lyase activating enzyme
VETCGFGNSSDFARAELLTDLFLFDLKVLDSGRHERDTGQPNGRILNNLRLLAGRAPEKLTIRVPLIPGFTDDLPNLRGIAAFVRDLGLHRVELEPYHSLGLVKYTALGRGDEALPAGDPQDAPTVREAQAIFQAHGLQCEIGGF